MEKPVKLALAAFLAVALMSCGNQARQEDATEIAEDRNEENLEDTKLEKASDFVVKAADGGMLEVQLGKLAQEKATTPEVRKFAETMVQEHSKTNEELKTLAQQKNITVPASISEEYQEKYNDLQEKQGIEFDREYMDFMVKDHEDDVKLFEKQAENGEDPDLKSWASDKVSALRHHLDMAKSTESIVDQQSN